MAATMSTVLAWSDWFGQKFWDAYGPADALPDACPLGFLTMFIAALVLMPFILVSALRVVWSLARVGKARKTMSSFFIVVLGVPLYPILAALLLALFFLSVRILSLASVVIGPVALVYFAVWSLMVAEHEMIEAQNEIRNDEDVEVEDIGCGSMILGITFGVCSLATLGLVSCCFTVVKFPLVFLSLFFRLWHWFVNEWLKAVPCPWSKPEMPLGGRSWDEAWDEAPEPEMLLGERSWDEACEAWQSCLWMWSWFPCVLLAWLVCVLLLFPCVFILLFCIVLVAQMLTFAIWPAYVTAGWLRYAGPQGGRRRHGSTCSAMGQGVRGSYQLLWASDVLTNLLICGNFCQEEYLRTIEELLRYIAEDTVELQRCRKLSLLPPMRIGLSDTWDFAAQQIARQLGIGKDQVQEAWNSLARQMIRIGREAVEDGWITRDWVQEIPVELCIGLPARTLLETLERSPKPGQIVLSSGLVLDMQPPGHGHATLREIWDYLMLARDARAKVKLTGEEREALCAMLLAGGGDADQLPSGLATAVRSSEACLGSKHSACLDVLRPLISMSLLCGKQEPFKQKLQLIIGGITSDDADDYLRVIRRHSKADLEACSEWSSDGSSSDSSQ